MSSKRFETTYNRDYCSQARTMWRQNNDDSGISSEDESDNTTENPQTMAEGNSECFCTKRASNYTYIHHINPTEHFSRYDNKASTEIIKAKQ